MTPAAKPRPSPPPFRGHASLRASLARALSRHELPATLLIHGIPGCGKQSLALWIARTRLCEGSPRPCDRCLSCRRALALEHPDIHWYFPLPRPGRKSSPEKLADALEDARAARLAEFRKQPLRPNGGHEVKGIYIGAVRSIRERASKRPSISDEQVFIVGDAEYLIPQEASPEAANALLKLLEEPPPGSRFILTSGAPGSLLDTVRSRALPIHLPPLSTTTVAAFLEEECGATPEAAREAAARSQGSIGAAIGELDPESELSRERLHALKLLRAAIGGKPESIFAAALDFGPGGARGLVGLLGTLQLRIRDLAAASLGREGRVVDVGEMPFLRRAGKRLALTPERAARAVAQVEEARRLALGNVNPQLFVAALLLDLRETLVLDSRESLASPS